MTGSIYLRPEGLISGLSARTAVQEGHAGWLAGGPVAFSAVSVIEGAPGASRGDLRSYAELSTSKDGAIGETLERIVAPRPPIAGLALDRPRLMGVVNVTPDSFSDGGLYDTAELAIAHGARLSGEGADIVDIGGESTRPGSDPVEASHEIERIIPVIEGLKGAGSLISADTRKAGVMEKAARAGAEAGKVAAINKAAIAARRNPPSRS